MKKILFYINTLERGGAERVLVNLANQFVLKNYNIILVNSFKCIDEYEVNNFVRHYYLERNDIETSKLKKNYSRLKSLVNIVKKEKPDLIISFLPEANFRSIMAGLITKTKCIVSVRNDPNKEYASKSYFISQKLLYPFADGIVFQTKDAQSWFPKKIKNKSKIIFNQVDKKFFYTEKLGEEYYCAVGRLTEQKNFRMLIDAFSVFVKEFKDEKLYIYGEGELRNELQNQINALDMENNIYLKGLSDNIYKVLSKSKCFILSSNYEGMPNVLLEAMAVGLPVISTDCPCGGPRELIDNGNNGLLIKINDKDMLIECLKKVQLDENYRNKLAKNSKVSSSILEPEKIFGEWEEYANYIIKK